MTLHVNGEAHEILVDPTKRLLDVLRFDLGLTGSKEGCGSGDCGACTVLVDGKTITSCLMLVGQAANREILTIEGVSDGMTLHPVQQTFIDYGAIQCGFCTPGLIMSAYDLLRRNPHPTEYQVREAIAGNLCRCTGYAKVVKAILVAADQQAAAV